jgi:ubiquinone/menaquinone biosynthesis C-methylase UbiE
MNQPVSSIDYFAGVAESWDEMRSGYFTEEMRDAAIERTGLSPQAKVADVGTGTGFMIRGLAPRVCCVYGFDQSPEMVAVARRNLAEFDNVYLQEAPGDCLPVPDGMFDAVFANMYLHHTPHPAAAINELARLLKPGGKMVILDLDAHNQEWMRQEMADRWLGFRREDIQTWFAAAGLVDVTVECAQGKCRSTTPGGNDMALTIFSALGEKV